LNRLVSQERGRPGELAAGAVDSGSLVINGDTNVIANAPAWADENSRAGVAAIFAAAPELVRAKYGSADQYVLSLFNHSGRADDHHTLLSFGFRRLGLYCEQNAPDGRMP